MDITIADQPAPEPKVCAETAISAPLEKVSISRLKSAMQLEQEIMAHHENDSDVLSLIQKDEDASQTFAAAPEESETIKSLKRKSFSIAGVTFPLSAAFIFATETCERFSFYGLRAILALYLNDYLLFSEDKSVSIIHLFTFAAYLTPLFGGWLSDTYWGKFKTIFNLSIVYTIGGVFLSTTAIPGSTGTPPSAWGCAIGLILIAIGTGGIKPCVASFGGEQFPPGNEAAITSFFSIFYMSINLGSLFSTFFTPMIRANSGFAMAFGVPAMLLAVATTVFYFGKPTYKMYPPSGNVLGEVASIIYISTQHYFSRLFAGERGVPEGGQFLDPARSSSSSASTSLQASHKRYSDQLVNEVRSVLSVLKVFIPLPIFWALFDQQSSRWIFQAEGMNLHITSSYELTADQISTVNPLLILILVPLFEKYIYPACRRMNINIKPLRRMTYGMIISAGAFIVSGFIQISIDAGRKPHVVFQLPQYLLITIGEVLVSIVSLEFAFSQAPPSLKAFIQACYLLTVAAGNLIIMAVAESSLFASRSAELFFFAALMGLFAFIFMWITRGYKYRVAEADNLPQPSSSSSSSSDSASPAIAAESSSSAAVDSAMSRKDESEAQAVVVQNSV